MEDVEFTLAMIYLNGNCVPDVWHAKTTLLSPYHKVAAHTSKVILCFGTLCARM